MAIQEMLEFLQYEFLHHRILGNTGRDWVIALSFFLIILIGMRIFRFFILKHIKKLADKTSNQVDDLLFEFIEEIHAPLYYYAALYVATRYLVLSQLADKVMWYMMVMFAIYYLVMALHKVIDYFVKRKISERDDDDDSLIIVMGMIIKGFIWVIAILLILSNFGINIASLIAGLGIGGIAIAFALQKVLEDVFSSFSIYFDKPFQAGDFIQVDNDQGTVKHIGLKTTRIVDLKGEELIIPNSTLTSSRIHNYKRLEKRRVVFNFGIEYSTPVSKVKKVTKIVESLFSKHKEAELDRVFFRTFGDSALQYEVVYFVKNSDFKSYLAIQQDINIGLMESFEKEKISFAFPTQVVYMRKE
jgi:small-conductance mechanosensitive channel